LTQQNGKKTVSNLTDKDTLIETLLQERDELYQELSKLRQMNGGAQERYESLIREKDLKISRLDEKVTRF
jgi:transposase